jgi:hypothetical protein
VPGKRAEPVRRVDLPICFGTPANFRKETLTFEVVGFHRTYHAILGRPCYARIEKWTVELMGETLSYTPRKAIKS